MFRADDVELGSYRLHVVTSSGTVGHCWTGEEEGEGVF